MNTAPTTVLLIRHADVHNPQDIVYGRLARFGLSTLGHMESERTAAALAGTAIQALYSSPLLRARQTAAHIAALYAPPLEIRISRLLQEVKTGWQGTPNKVMAERKYNYYENRAHPDDEDVDMVLARMLLWIERVLSVHRGQTVVGISHGDPTMMVRLLYSGQPVTPETLRQTAYYPAKGSILRLVFPVRGPARTLQPTVEYTDPSAAEHAAQEAAAKAAAAARGETGETSPWAGTSGEQET